jgi:serine/threonine protein kinase
MTNEFNGKTEVRSRGMPFRPAPHGEREQSMNVLPVGTHLGEFEILDLIGEGGFGIVYLAYDHSLERNVALKEYMPSGLAMRTTKMAVSVRSEHNAETFSAGLKSFINEAKILAQFDSPALVKVYRFWEGNGTAYMVMPFYEGITLKQAYKDHRITPTEPWLRLLLADLFDAIDIIHGAQCLHRDIAPDNILLLRDGRPLLLDFGAARRVIGDLTQCLTAILKPGYAPIEQYADIAGLRQGPWTDIYALAAVVYYLIAGKAPPPAVARMVRDELVPAREVGKGKYSNAFLAVLDKALAVKPEQRFKSIAEVRRALDIMETAPRTLPEENTDWATVALRSQPAETKTKVAPKLEPTLDARPEPKSAQHTKPAPQPAAQQEDDWTRMAWARQPEPPRRAGSRSWPEWLLLGLLLSAGIAFGVYWEMQREGHQQVQQTVSASAGGTAMESSGASETQEQEPAEQAVAPQPAPTETEPPPVATAPASPSEPTETAPPPVATVPASPEAAATEAEQPSEIDLWRMASKSDKAIAYENYLKTYPDGRYASLAKLRLERMQAKTAPPVPPAAGTPAPQQEAKAKPKAGTPSAEESLWSTVTAINEAPAYEAYLHQYPRGRYAALAKDRLASARPDTPAAPPQTVNPPVQEAAPPKRDEEENATRQASIKPPEPSVPAAPKQVPEAMPKPVEEALQSIGKALRIGDQTLTGSFSIDLKTGAVSGTGKIVWNNGNQFEGTLVRGVKEGKGKFAWNNGQRYSGDWANDMPNGKGTIIFADGTRYEGEVKDGTPHGRGIARYKAGDTYNGAWVRGKSQGQGRYTWASGNYWEGEFKDDKRTDNGKMVFAGSAAQPAAGTQASERSATGGESTGQ